VGRFVAQRKRSGYREKGGHDPGGLYLSEVQMRRIKTLSKKRGLTVPKCPEMLDEVWRRMKM